MMEDEITVQWVAPEAITASGQCTHAEYNRKLFQHLHDIEHDSTMSDWRREQIVVADRYRDYATNLRGEADAYEQKAHDILLRLVDRSSKR